MSTVQPNSLFRILPYRRHQTFSGWNWRASYRFFVYGWRQHMTTDVIRNIWKRTHGGDRTIYIFIERVFILPLFLPRYIIIYPKTMFRPLFCLRRHNMINTIISTNFFHLFIASTHWT